MSKKSDIDLLFEALADINERLDKIDPPPPPMPELYRYNVTSIMAMIEDANRRADRNVATVIPAGLFDNYEAALIVSDKTKLWHHAHGDSWFGVGNHTLYGGKLYVRDGWSK